jgi:hypothetical protein
MGHEDRDQNFAQALTRQLRAAGGNGTANEHVTDCPDAEMLAAFHERVLSSREMDATKEHVVGCSRCQEVLALLETTDDIVVRNEQENVLAMPTPVLVSSAGNNVEASSEAEVAARPIGGAREPQNISHGRRPRVWRWVAPVGAIAASLLLWVVARESKVGQLESVQNVQIAREQGKNGELADGRSTVAPSPAPPPDTRQSPDQLRANESASTQTEQALKGRPLPGRSPESVRGNAESGIAGDHRAGASAGVPVGVVGGGVREHSAAEQTGRESATLSMGPQKSGSSAPGHAQKSTVAPSTEAANTTASAPANAANDGDRKKTQSVTAASEAAETPDNTPANADSGTTTKPDNGRNVVGKEILRTLAANTPRAQARASKQADPPASKTAPSSTAENRETAHTQVDHPNGDSLPVPTESVEIGSQLKRDPAITNVSNKNARIILVPGGTIEWRLGAPSIIERSVDGGLTWTRQTTGTSAELLAGAAPNEVVCWIVGRNGTILRTTDGGGHWSEVVSPIAGDIGGITADDAMHAVVMDMGAIPARFGTNDGGVTWFRTNK